MLCTNILINNTTHGHTYGIVALFFCCNARVFNQGISDWEWEEDEEMIWCYQGQAPSPRNGSSSFAWATCASGYSSPTVFGMGATNSSTMGMQQQQQGVYGNMQAGAQNVQSMAGLQNQTQNPNFTQQIQQNQQ
ncbi:uncharacterized protein [Zea mays]|nr:uncharacterized protein LOC103643961 [Zea mays]|eukprot:XP_020402507.1 uncharacterized protein LOC103643961 [Zea mays]